MDFEDPLTSTAKLKGKDGTPTANRMWRSASLNTSTRNSEAPFDAERSSGLLLHHDGRTDRDPLIEICHILVPHPETAGR